MYIADWSQRNSSQINAKSQSQFSRVNTKYQIQKHFKQSSQNLYGCNYCGFQFDITKQPDNALITHLNRMHSEQFYGTGKIKKEEEEIINDFLDMLVLAGYPVDKIVDGLTKLYINHKESYFKLMNQFVGHMPQIREQMQKILQVLPLDTDKDIVNQLFAQFFPNLSQRSRKSLIQQYFWVYSSQQQIVNKFKEHGYNIITLYDQQNLNLMMLITDQMRKMYFKYGDCLCIDVVDKVYKKKSPYGFADYSTWFFTGQDQNLQNVLFGFAITNEENDKNIEFLFQNFFKQMNSIYPISICIPPYIVFHEQIKKVAPEVKIIVNWYHKLKFLKQILQNQIEVQSIMKSICDCFKTPCKAQFNFLVNRILSKVSDQSAIKYGVQHQNENFCIHKLSLKFIGFSIQVKRYLDLERQVRQVFIYQGNLARLFIYVIRLDKKLNQRHLQKQYQAQAESKMQASQHHQQSEVIISEFQSNNYIGQSISHQNSRIRTYKLSKFIKERIDYSLSELGTYKMEVVDPITVMIMTRKTHVARWKVFTICFRVQHDYWECNCRFLKHTGIPCAHLIKVLQKFGGNYRFYINTRWLVNQ